MLTLEERLKDELLSSKVLRRDQIQVVIEEKNRTSENFDELCIKLGFIDSPTVKKILSKITGISYIDLKNVSICDEYFKIFDFNIQKQYHFIVFSRQKDLFKIAMIDPHDLSIRDLIQNELISRFGLSVSFEFFYTDREVIEELLQKARFSTDNLLSEPQVPFEGTSDIVKLFETILQTAMTLQVSDIHFQPTQQLIQVRFRKDGLLQTAYELHPHIWPNIVIRIKILANLDISESRRPQSGHFNFEFNDQKFDFRVSTHPTLHGENIVIRILYRHKEILSLEQLGFNPEAISFLQDIIKQPYGLILLCGPTGSGKTTTLYTLCSQMDAVTQNIMTLEEPVEYQFENIRQTEIQHQEIMGFAEGIRSILRQDPDIIFIGEIRDEETAKMSLRSAMTGHLVLSTIHSNDALRAPSRLFDLGVTPSLLSGQLLMIMSQRLVRRLCVICHGKGCALCHYSGFKGRLAISEILPINEEMDACISKSCSIFELVQCAQKSGYIPLVEDGLYKVKAGLTTMDELKRVCGKIFDNYKR